MFVGDSIVRNTDRALNKGTTWLFAFQCQSRGGHRVGGHNPGKGGYIVGHIGSNNTEREGVTVIVRKYNKLEARYIGDGIIDCIQKWLTDRKQ